MLQMGNQSRAFIKKHSNLERIYFRIIEWGTYLILFTPLILIKSYYFPYVVPKTIFFRLIVNIIFVAYVLLVLSNRKYLPKFNALTIAVAVFVGITTLTSFTGVNLGKSFWSTFERMTGILTFFHLFAFFIILINVFRERKHWERILTISIIVGVIESLYALFTNNPSSRSGGTIGNVSFMATYLLFDIFFAVILLFIKRGGWRIFYGITLLILLSPLFFSVELPRGALGAFFVGIVLLGLGYMLFSGKKLLKRLAPAVLVLVVLATIGISQTRFFKENFSADIKKELPGEARLIIWRMSFEAWKERPWLGWGQENFNIAFAKHFDPKLAGTGDLWYDRAHNIVLDMVVASGLIGLLSYLSIFVIAVFGLLKLCPKIIEKKNTLFPLGMVALLAVYLAQNIWVFDMISSYMIFFLSLAFVYFLIQGGNLQPLPQREGKTGRVFQFFGTVLIIITVFTFYFGNIQSARASHYTVLGVVFPLERAIPAFQKAIESSPMSIVETPEQFSRKVTDLVFDKNVDKELLKNGFELAAIEMKKSIDKSPLDFRAYLILGREYNSFYLLTQDKEKLEQAEIYLKKALEISPKNQQAYWSFAQNRLLQDKEEEAIDLMQKAVDLNPKFGESHWNLAMIYRAIGQHKLALEKVEDAEEAGYNWKEEMTDLKKVIELYQNVDDEEKLLELYLLAIEKEPKNAQFRAGLAVVYANLGQFDKARQLAEEAISLNPDFKAELEEFLRQLPK